jgi:hypothetical protein
LSPGNVLLHSVSKLGLLGALDDPVVLGVDVETIMEPWKQTQQGKHMPLIACLDSTLYLLAATDTSQKTLLFCL